MIGSASCDSADGIETPRSLTPADKVDEDAEMPDYTTASSGTINEYGSDSDDMPDLVPQEILGAVNTHLTPVPSKDYDNFSDRLGTISEAHSVDETLPGLATGGFPLEAALISDLCDIIDGTAPVDCWLSGYSRCS